MSDFDFWLDPDGLDDEAAALDSWADGMASLAEAMSAIVVTSEQGAESYSNATTVCRDVHTGLLRWLAHMQNVFHSISRELRDVAQEGRETDMATAARMDLYDAAEYNNYAQQYPTIQVGGYGKAFRPPAPAIAPSSDVHPLGSNDAAAPRWYPTRDGYSFVNAPSGSFDNVDEFAVTLFDNAILDPVGEIAEALGAMGVERPRDEIFKGFGGSWWALAEYAYVLNGFSTFLTEMHSGLVQIFGGVGMYWQGYAANSAQLYFSDVVAGVAAASNGSFETSKKVTDYIASVKSYAEIVSGLLEDLAADACLAALLIAAGKKTGSPLIVAGGPIAAGMKVWQDVTYWVGETLLIAEMLDTAFDLAKSLEDITSNLHVLEMYESS